MRIILAIIAIVISIQGWSQTLNVGSTGQIIVSPQSAIVVDGSIKNNGEITIENNGSLIQTGSGTANSGTGNYTIKREGTTAVLAYNMWSSPVTLASIQGTGNVFSSTNPCDMYVFNATTQEWKYDWATPYTTTCAGNTVTFTAATNMTDGTANGVMDIGRGYFMPGNGTSAERVFTGNVNTGNISVPVVTTTLGDKPTWTGDDWNMIGNPYPSAVSMSAFWTENTTTNATITDGLYFWVDDGTGGSGYQENNSYTVYNSTGAAVGGTTGGTSPAIQTEFIASGQGFWVHAAAAANVSFTNSMRTGTNYSNSGFYKRSTDIQRAWISLDRGASRSNQILLGLTNDATVGYDPAFDARRLHSTVAIELSFVQDTALYQILGQPTISYNEQEVLPLHVHNDTTGMHSFVLDSTQNVNGGNAYYLIDSLLNVTHDLATPYTVQLDTGNHDNRFYLLYKDIINGVEDTQAPTLFVKAYQSGDYIKLQSNKIDITDVTIYNTVGTQVISQTGINTPFVSINVNSLSNGVYLVNYTLENGQMETQKMVIH